MHSRQFARVLAMHIVLFFEQMIEQKPMKCVFEDGPRRARAYAAEKDCCPARRLAVIRAVYDEEGPYDTLDLEVRTKKQAANVRRLLWFDCVGVASHNDILNDAPTRNSLRHFEVQRAFE